MGPGAHTFPFGGVFSPFTAASNIPFLAASNHPYPQISGSWDPNQWPNSVLDLDARGTTTNRLVHTSRKSNEDLLNCKIGQIV